MGPPKREPTPTQHDHMHHPTAAPEHHLPAGPQQFHHHQPPPPPPPHNTAEANYTYPPPPHDMGAGANPHYNHQPPPPQDMGGGGNPHYNHQPPPPQDMGGGGNPHYNHQPPPPPVVQFPPPSPVNMHQAAAAFPPAKSYPPSNDVSNAAAFPPAKSYPPSNDVSNAAAFPPAQNGFNGQQQQYGNGYNNMNMNMNQSMAPPQKAVYHNAPAHGIPMSAAGTPVAAWKTGLFDCMDDPMNAIVTAFFPCLTFGQIAEIVDGGHTSCATSGMLYGVIGFFLGLPFIMSCTYRTKLRNMFGLSESPAPDWVTHLLCECCALCQEYRELQLRGYDPSIGWLGNQAMRQNQPQQVMMAPANQRMMG